ncbi:carbohydrate binding family 9 domain-containing protein [Flavobacteriales bacterium]|nr:carbohydrate binding family 9 domain-containing protein [Flavobacteriales bacterium]
MKLIREIVVLTMISTCVTTWGQSKTVRATRATEKIRIDGLKMEADWEEAEVATNFLERNPTEGNQPRFKTEVKVIYDDNNIYFLGHCYDDNPDSILTQLGERDDKLNADLFSISIDPYNKMLDAFIFSVSASGVQSDFRLSDPEFNAVWESATRVVEDGWIVEMKIPYYAFRFPKGEKQDWKVQFSREIRRSRTELQWSLVPKNIETPLNYWGTLKGLNNIQDPLRLSLSPYVSSFVQTQNGEATLGYGAGADLKLGLNESFTLDMTLLPDFSQVRSDNIVKNLGAFEVVFEEQRPFFQEGVDLFNLGDLFYSRRIGGPPQNRASAYADLDSNEVVSDNPINSQLLNVAKISGRNKNGLGIGFMNALTSSTKALIQDTVSRTIRELETNPLTNYNIFSFDKNLKNNSSIYLINLSTLRAGKTMDANVISAGLNLISKSSKYSMSGNATLSQRDTNLIESLTSFDGGDGLRYSFSVGKIQGNFKYSFSTENKSANFNPNDLGVNFISNVRTHSVNLQYNKYNPFWILNKAYNRLSFSINQNYTTGEVLNKKYDARYFWTFPSFNSVFVDMSSQIGDGIDLFESRVPGQKFIVPEWYFNGIGISSDYRKKLALDGNIGFGYAYFSNYIKNSYFNVGISPIVRLSDKLTLTPSSEYTAFKRGAGFAGFFNNQPKYGVRDVFTVENVLQGKYLFKNNLSLTLRIRHYWSYGIYRYYGDLDEDGFIVPDEDFKEDSDFNFNAFNTDLIFAWQFAPGSFLNVVYKNALQRDESELITSYINNLGSVFDQRQQNTITMKLIYFFDTVSSYKKLKKHLAAK